MNWKHSLLRSATATGLLAGLVAVPAATASAATTVTAPATIYYGIDGPNTPVTVGFVTEAAPSITRVEIAGTVVGADCAAGPTPLPTTIIGGDAVIEADLGTATSVACDLVLDLASTTPPASGLVEVIEQDVFSTEIARGSSSVALTPVDITTTTGDVELVGGAYQPYFPRSIGDTLRYTLGVAAASSVPLSVQSSTGAAVTGCPPATTTALNCVVERSLSVDDLTVEAAPMSATVFAGGFPVAEFDRTVDVFAERRLGLDLTVTPLLPAVGDQLSISLVVENQGSVDLTDFVLTGGDLGSLDCAGQPITALALAPSEAVTCTSGRSLTVADVGPNTAITVRATSAVPGDSDLVDDDPTTDQDVDSSLPVPFTVGDADIQAFVTIDDPLVWLPSPSTPGGASVGATTGSISVATAHDPDFLRVEMQLEPAPGVRLTDCDDIVGSWCRMSFAQELWTWEPGQAMTRSFGVEIDADSMPADGFVDVPVGGELVADLGIRMDVVPATVSATGFRAAMTHAVLDVTGTETTGELVVSTLAGAGMDLVVEPAAGTSVDSCTDSTGDIAVSAIAGRYALGPVDPVTDVTCRLTISVTDAMRMTHLVETNVDVVATSGGTTDSRSLVHIFPARSIEVSALAPAPAPEHGYHPEGDDGRPHSVVQPFEVRVLGEPGASPAEPSVTAASPNSAATCVPIDDSGWTCSVERDITAADLSVGSVDLAIDATVSIDEMTLEASGSATAEVLYEQIEMTVTELSSPSTSSGYWVGESMQLLVQVRNTGTMPVDVDDVGVGGASSTVVSTRPSPSMARGAGTLAPGETYEVALTVRVSEAELVAGEATLSFTIGSDATATTVMMRLPMTLDEPPAPQTQPQPQPQPVQVGQPGGPVAELPATGTSPALLLAAGAVFALLGLVIRRRTVRPSLRVTFTSD